MFDFVEIIEPIQQMIKKNVQFKWKYFEKVKDSIEPPPALKSLDFSKDFSLYTFVADHSLMEFLTQEDQQGNECPIEFMSTGLEGVE
jgi:hypothetical protein